MAADTVHDFKLKDIEGKEVDLSEYKDKVVLIVNVASQCGATPQYEQMQALHDKYSKKGLVVIGVPCNQFGGQEPGTAAQIDEFCSTTYGISFPMTEKIAVNGADRHPIYAQLTAVADASGHSGDIRWNFEKFVVSADGATITRFAPTTKPDDPAVLAAIEQGLPAAAT